jgi:hypothetical protein
MPCTMVHDEGAFQSHAQDESASSDPTWKMPPAQTLLWKSAIAQISNTYPSLDQIVGLDTVMECDPERIVGVFEV